MPLTFAVTWDYRCGVARNFHEHVAVALEGGADWDVTFVPFSLTQNSRDDGEPAVWDEPHTDTGLLALQVGVLVRDEHPDRFPAVHRELYAVRHDHGLKLTDPTALRSAVDRHGLDGAGIVDRALAGEAIPTVRKEHEWAVDEYEVWGVPTVITADDAVFIRLNNRSDGVVETSRVTIERAVALIGCWPDLNEFKHTRLTR